jgi:5-methyltetrahydrofolate--homocysteine methyltransferase
MRWLENATSVLRGCTRNVSGDFKEKKLTAKAVYGAFPANQINDDDIELTDGKRKTITNILDLRQQLKKPKSAKFLADFIAPKDNGVTDYMGFCDHGFVLMNGR